MGVDVGECGWFCVVVFCMQLHCVLLHRVFLFLLSCCEALTFPFYRIVFVLLKLECTQ